VTGNALDLRAFWQFSRDHNQGISSVGLPASAGVRILARQVELLPPMRHLRWLVFWLSFVLSSAAAQHRQLVPERIERATYADDKGVQQWAEYKPEKCPTCDGKGKHTCQVCDRFIAELETCVECKFEGERQVTCHTCAGEGTLPDPLEKVACPGCRGAAYLPCTVCGGSGKQKLEGDKAWNPCPVCRGSGGWKCAVCNGERMVDVTPLKPSFKDGSLKDIGKAKAAVDSALKELGAITPVGGDKSRKEVKAMVKALEPAAALHPALKRFGKAFEDYMGKIYAGNQIAKHEENEAAATKLVKDNAENLLKHQKRMLELAHKRAEANQKVAGAEK
jgi:hypothetical protein